MYAVVEYANDQIVPGTFFYSITTKISKNIVCPRVSSERWLRIINPKPNRLVRYLLWFLIASGFNALKNYASKIKKIY